VRGDGRGALRLVWGVGAPPRRPCYCYLEYSR